MSLDPVSEEMWAELEATPGIPDPSEQPPDGGGYVIVMLTQPAMITLRDYYRLCGCPQCERLLGKLDMDPGCDGCADLGTACPDHQEPQ